MMVSACRRNELLVSFRMKNNTINLTRFGLFVYNSLII